MTDQEILSTAELSERLRVPGETLRWWRKEGRGPRWIRIGVRQVGYRLPDVEEWIESRYEVEYHYTRRSA